LPLFPKNAILPGNLSGNAISMEKLHLEEKRGEQDPFPQVPLPFTLFILIFQSLFDLWSRSIIYYSPSLFRSLYTSL
jgi:hypothetical protein